MSDAAPPRTVRVAAVQLWSSPERTPEDNRAHALEMLETAARARPDLVVLPEAVSMLCYPDGRPDFTYRDVAEPVPGPTTDAAAAIARRYGVNVVLGLIADEGPDAPCQNTVVGLDRAGSLAGRYNKLHEPEACRTHQAAGVGDALGVFDLDFGRIGVFVCWDLIAPEIPALLALRGAALLVFPHLIGLPAARNFAVSLRARAVDSALPLIAAWMRDAGSHSGTQDGLAPTCVLDADGAVIAQTLKAGPDVVLADVPLGPVRVDFLGRLEPGVDWSAQRIAELRPGLYARLYAEGAATCKW
jgi:predicted amidohydrolase